MTDAELRRLAEAAKEGDRSDPDDGTWTAYSTVHGDPYVVADPRRPMFTIVAIVATVATAPPDYGRARALYVAAADPATVLGLLDRIRDLEQSEADAADWM